MIDRAEYEERLSRARVATPFDSRLDRPLDRVGELVEAMAARIGTTDRMLAASYLHQSVTTRLAGPLLTGACVASARPQFGLGDLRWSWIRGSLHVGLEGHVAGRGLVPSDPTDTLEHVLGVFEQWAATIRAETTIGTRLLHGNAAASLAAALRRLETSARLTPEEVESLLARIESDHAHAPVIKRRVVDGWGTFQRRTCCLIRFGGSHGVCEECNLLEPSEFEALQRLHRLFPG